MTHRDFYELSLRDLLVHENEEIQKVAAHLAYRLNLDQFGVEQPLLLQDLNIGIPTYREAIRQPPAS